MNQYQLTTRFHLNSYTAKQVGIVLPDENSADGRVVVTGTYRQLMTLAAQLRYEFITQNGYNPIRVTRSKGNVTYTVMPHFGMKAYILARIDLV